MRIHRFAHFILATPDCRKAEKNDRDQKAEKNDHFDITNGRNTMAGLAFSAI
jgi:hypothetical protein